MDPPGGTQDNFFRDSLKFVCFPYDPCMVWGYPDPLTVESEGSLNGALHKNEQIVISLASWVGDTPNVWYIYLHLPLKTNQVLVNIIHC